MLIAKIAVNGVHATSTKLGTLTSGMVGAKVQFFFNSSWEGLSKTAVFRCRDIVKDVLNIDSEVTIPHEVLVRSGSALEVGVYGTNADGSLVIPTVWITVDIVYGGADPSGDPSAELTPGAVDQMMIILAETKKAAEEAHQKAADAVKPYTLRAEDAAAASGQFANASNMSAESAGKHEANARASENNAKQSEQNAKTFETNAATSESNAKNSAQSAEQSARNALSSEQNALNSAKNAATSEQNVAAAAAAAAKSAKNAKASEDNSKATWDFAKDEARAAQAARKAAEDAAADASVSKNATLQAAEQASIDAQSAKNSATRADQVLDAALSVQTATVGQFLIVEEVNENGKPIRWKGVDRTHWTEDRGKVEILPECQPTYIPNDGMFSLEFASSLSNLVVGETYIVNWNGTEYSCVGQDMSAMTPGAVLLGEGSNFGFPSTGEPFMIAGVKENGAYGLIAVPLDGTTELTLSIYQSGEIVHKLDNKYLDLDWLPVMEKVEATILPIGEVNCSESNGMGYYRYMSNSNLSLVGGRKYTVLWDGTSYDCACTAQYNESMVLDFYLLGNNLLTDSNGVDTGEPFCFYSVPAGPMVQIHATAQGVHITEIIENDEMPNKLPEAYFPESVDGIIIRSSTADSTKKFKITVDDSGTIAATEVT